MNTPTPLQQSWHTYWILKKHRPEPAWARLLITGVLGMGIAIVLVTVAGLLSGNLGRWVWWRNNLAANLVVCLCIAYTIHALFRSLEWILSEAILQKITGWRDWRAGAFFSVLGISGSLMGGLLGLGWISLIFQMDAWATFTAQPRAISNFLLITALITLANWVYWRSHAKRQALQLQATESQLRLLQAQIEPHFLFNTLANVQSLIDYDTPRAKAMLEAFTDYLRSSFNQLRDTDATLGAELDMAQSYLNLLQIRMMERLTFSVDVAPELRCMVLPPLLLQPMVENAIHHGLEPKVEGGNIRISARVNGEGLEISVEDNGLGLDAPRRPGRAGQGIALDNIRARLATRYAERASFSLQPLSVGTRATIRIPLAPAA